MKKENIDDVIKMLGREIQILLQTAKLTQKQKDEINAMRLEYSAKQKKLLVQYMNKELKAIRSLDVV
jgi:Spy/CpxP family protein refolding chaperone